MNRYLIGLRQVGSPEKDGCMAHRENDTEAAMFFFICPVEIACTETGKDMLTGRGLAGATGAREDLVCVTDASPGPPMAQAHHKSDKICKDMDIWGGERKGAEQVPTRIFERWARRRPLASITKISLALDCERPNAAQPAEDRNGQGPTLDTWLDVTAVPCPPPVTPTRQGWWPAWARDC